MVHIFTKGRVSQFELRARRLFGFGVDDLRERRGLLVRAGSDFTASFLKSVEVVFETRAALVGSARSTNHRKYFARKLRCPSLLQEAQVHGVGDLFFLPGCPFSSRAMPFGDGRGRLQEGHDGAPARGSPPEFEPDRSRRGRRSPSRAGRPCDGSPPRGRGRKGDGAQQVEPPLLAAASFPCSRRWWPSRGQGWRARSSFPSARARAMRAMLRDALIPTFFGDPVLSLSSSSPAAFRVPRIAQHGGCRDPSDPATSPTTVSSSLPDLQAACSLSGGRSPIVFRTGRGPCGLRVE